jgi:DNA-binding transcriptional LysR family regulator
VAPRPLFQVDHALFMPKTLERTLQHGDPNDLTRIASTPLVEVTGASAKALALARRHVGPRLHIGLRCETFPQAARAVATGGYMAVLPAMAAASLQGLAAMRPLPGGTAREDALYIATRKSIHDSRPAVAETFEALLHAIAPLRR